MQKVSDVFQPPKPRIMSEGNQSHCKLVTTHAYLSTQSILPEPRTMFEALIVPEWKKAMNEEFEALLGNKT